MKRIREPIPENLKVKLSTEQEWKDVLQILEDDDYLWVNGCKPTAWRSEKYNIVHLKNELIYTTNDEKDTISAQSFINTYSEKLLYEVGDVVVVEKIGEDWYNKSSIGKTTKITEIGSCGSILLDNNKYYINYRPEWLRPATEEEIKVYQQSQKPQYHINNIKGKKIAVRAKTEELWEKVCQIVCSDNPGRINKSDWKHYKENSTIQHEDTGIYGSSYANVEWFQDREYTIVEAEEFLRDNNIPIPSQKPVDNRTKLSFKTEDGYDLYEGDQVHWIMDTKIDPKPWVYQQLNGVGEWSLQYIERDNRIFHSKENAEKYIEEQNRPKEPVYTVGDWVCLKPDMMYGVITKELKSNTPYKVAKESITGTCIELEGYSEPLSKDRFRPATPEEVAKATGTSTVKESIPVIVVGDTVEVKVYCNVIDGEIGTVITVDDGETTMPYEVKIPNKGTFWLTKEEVKKVTTNQKSQTKIKENDKDNQTNSNNSNQQSISKQQDNEQKSISYVRRNPTIIKGSGDHSGKAIATVCKVKPTISKK